MSPTTIGRCGGGGGGGARIFFMRLADPSTLNVLSGVARELKWGTEATNDVSGVALNFGGITPQRPELVSGDFLYSVWCSAYWPVFAGDRQLQVVTADFERGWPIPVEATNQEQLQWVSGMVHCEFTVPTEIITTVAQTTGATVNLTNAWMLIQACELL